MPAVYFAFGSLTNFVIVEKPLEMSTKHIVILTASVILVAIIASVIGAVIVRRNCRKKYLVSYLSEILRRVTVHKNV